MRIGEAFVGSGAEAAHINTVVGGRDGPVGVAWATALATPTTGHARFLTVLQPGLPVQPPTLFVNKAPIADDRHGALTWGAAQAGVADGVVAALEDGSIDASAVGDLLLIVAVWVDPAATDEAAVHANNRAATAAALAAGTDGRPSVEDLRAARRAWNPYFRAP
jgi:5,6,7,8-tetrahydromethanopterin hydro-lyase